MESLTTCIKKHGASCLCNLISFDPPSGGNFFKIVKTRENDNVKQTNSDELTKLPPLGVIRNIDVAKTTYTIFSLIDGMKYIMRLVAVGALKYSAYGLGNHSC